MWFKFLPSLQERGEGPCHRYTKNVHYLYCDMRDHLSNRFCLFLPALLLQHSLRCFFFFLNPKYSGITTLTIMSRKHHYLFVSSRVWLPFSQMSDCCREHLGQVGGEIITSAMADIWGPDRDKNTASHMHSCLGNFPQKEDSYWRWIKRCFPGMILSSFTPIRSPIFPLYAQNVKRKKKEKCISFNLLVYISCILILECVKCQWLSGLTRQRVAEWTDRLSPISNSLLCISCPIGGAMTSRSSCRSPLSSVSHCFQDCI